MAKKRMKRLTEEINFSKYSKAVTDRIISHVGHRKNVGLLLSDEGAHKKLSIDADLVNLDAAAVQKATSEIPSTVDAVLGCEGNIAQFVECKYRVGGKKKDRKKLTPPSESELKDKVLGSKPFLTSEALEVSIAPTIVLIFHDNNIQQARAWVNDYNAGKKKPLYTEMTTEQFIETFFKP